LSNFEIAKTSHGTNNFSTDPAPLPLGELVGPWRIRQAFFALFWCLANWYMRDRIWCPISRSRDGLRFAAAHARTLSIPVPPSASILYSPCVFDDVFAPPLASSSLTSRGGIVYKINNFEKPRNSYVQNNSTELFQIFFEFTTFSICTALSLY